MPARLSILFLFLTLVPIQAAPVRLMSKEDEAYYRKHLPATEDKTLLAFLARTDLIFYTDREMPPAYQFDRAVWNPKYNIAPSTEPHGNANVEFPWGAPAGTHRCSKSQVTKLRIIGLPGKIRWWSERKITSAVPLRPRFQGDLSELVYNWAYPKNTEVCEVLFQRDPDDRNKLHAFDLRLRTKHQDTGDFRKDWRVNAWRPILTRKEYDDSLTQSGGTAPPDRSYFASLTSTQTDRGIFDRRAIVDPLPAIEHSQVRKLLSRPFRSSLGQDWITRNGHEGHAPTTQADFHIVPKNYDGAFMRVDSKACMTCHQDILKEAGLLDNPREWYGFVRGSGHDGIFSFHIFDPASISPNFNRYEVNFRKELVEAGLLVHWDE